MVHYKLTYGQVRYLAEPIRLILRYAGQDFVDVRLTPEEFHRVKLGELFY